MKKAIALLELIFAIVVIGITLISVPNLIATTTKASYQAITQEAISNAASHMDLILSQFWDEAATNPKYNNPILVVDSGNSSLDEGKDSNGHLLGRRVGSAKSTSRRYAVDENGTKLKATPPANLGEDPDETSTKNLPDDVDDFDNKKFNLVYRENTTAEIGDYKDNQIEISTRVVYMDDKPSNFANYNNTHIRFDNPFIKIKRSSTNIKYITVRLKSSLDKTKEIVFRGFSCNIGSAKLKERKF